MKIAPLRQIAWFKEKERDFDILLESFYFGGGARRYFRSLGVDCAITNRISLSNRQIYYDRQEVARGQKILLAARTRLPALVAAITARFMVQARAQERFLKQAGKYQWSTQPRAALIRETERCFKSIYRLIPYSFIISINFDEVASKLVGEYLASRGRSPAAYAVLTAPSKVNQTTREHWKRVALAAKFRRLVWSPILARAVKAHVKRWQYLSCYRPTDEPLTEASLTADIQELAQSSQILPTVKEFSARQRQAARQATRLSRALKLPAWFKALISLVKYNAWVRTYRREIINHSFFVFRPLFLRVAKELGVAFKDLRLITAGEIISYLRAGWRFPRARLKARARCFVCLEVKGKLTVMAGAKAARFKVPASPSSLAAPATTTLHGLAVTKGTAVGRVFLVHQLSAVSQFPRGAILVAPTVATWMMPAVARAKGIVTDAGGLLSHTAVVAREFKIPCVIGTKVATQALKDGDMVEVDAARGVVQKVKLK